MSEQVTLTQAAQQLGISNDMIKKHVRELSIPVRRQAKYGFITPEDVTTIRKYRESVDARRENLATTHVSLPDAEMKLSISRALLNKYIRDLDLQPIREGTGKYLTPTDITKLREHKVQAERERQVQEGRITLKNTATTLGISGALLRYHLSKLCITPQRLLGGNQTTITQAEFDEVKSSLVEARHLDTAKRSTWHQKGHVSNRPNKTRYSGRKRTPEEMESARKMESSEPKPIEGYVSLSGAAFILTVRANQDKNIPPYQYIAPRSINQARIKRKFDVDHIRFVTENTYVYEQRYIIQEAPLLKRISRSRDLTPEEMADWIKRYPHLLREMQALGWHIPYLQEAQAINSRQRAIS